VFRREDAVWSYSEAGSGRPLVLLHGIGMSRTAWNAVTPYLCTTRRVVLFDIAGFGLTPPLPDGTLPTIANLVDALDRSIRGIGIDVPVDIAGNSLGGSIALEAARRGLARSVVAISPAGLWKEHGALHVQYVFGTMRFAARQFPGILKATVRKPLFREFALAVPLSAGSRRMPASDAIRAVDDLAASPAFEVTFDNTRHPLSGTDIKVPVTIAFGNRDWILPKNSQYRKRFPTHARWVVKKGWGHVPMWVDPIGVAQLILDGTQQAVNSDLSILPGDVR
jgi:pimeloyl-ACP methyl ester carboxylesterase